MINIEYLDLGIFLGSVERDYHGLCRPQGVPSIGLLGTIQWTDTAAVDWSRAGGGQVWPSSIVDRRSPDQIIVVEVFNLLRENAA